jgi:hypothetical protein
MNQSHVKTAHRLLGLLIFAALVCGFQRTGSAQTVQEIVAETIDDVSVEFISAAPDDAAAGPPTSVPEHEIASRHFTMIDVFKITALLSLFLIGYSLWMHGQSGRGWIAIAIAGGMITVAGKMILSMFVEVTNPYSPPDWDEE